MSGRVVVWVRSAWAFQSRGLFPSSGESWIQILSLGSRRPPPSPQRLATTGFWGHALSSACFRGGVSRCGTMPLAQTSSKPIGMDFLPRKRRFSESGKFHRNKKPFPSIPDHPVLSQVSTMTRKRRTIPACPPSFIQ